MKDKKYIKGANPYMPLWEHVPDGEPRVFTYNGESRVYVYGSHDSLQTEYCGKEYVVWSAPVDDLTDWSCHGVCYTATDGGVLYAPDVVQKGDTFYMYAAEDRNKRIMVAKSKHPAGPFLDPVICEVGIDPAVFVDDDGCAYAYWGFCGSYCAELNEDMTTLKPGTLREHPIGHADAKWQEETEHINYEDGFYEAASMRKVNGKYIFIYSKLYNMPCDMYGSPAGCNAALAYKWSDHPLDDFRDGGDIVQNGGEILHLPDGRNQLTMRWGNNHGGMIEINGKWYIFYHRHTGKQEFARQGMLEPIDVAIDKSGRVFIGDITYADGEPVSAKAVEMTSQGPQVNGLDAFRIISAGYTCHISGPTGAYIKQVYECIDSVSSPVMDIQNGNTVGFRYLQFGTISPKTMTVCIKAYADLNINVRLDDYRGKCIASGMVKKSGEYITMPLMSGVIGKHALYFEFLSKENGSIAEFDRFTFDR